MASIHRLSSSPYEEERTRGRQIFKWSLLSLSQRTRPEQQLTSPGQSSRFCKKFLDVLRSWEEINRLESRLRTIRSFNEDVIRADGVDYFTALDINQKEEICSKERDRYWSKLEVPSVNFGSGAAGESKRNDAWTTANHRWTVSHQQMKSVIWQSPWARTHRHRGAWIHQELSIGQDVLQEDEGRTAKLLWSWS